MQLSKMINSDQLAYEFPWEDNLSGQKNCFILLPTLIYSTVISTTIFDQSSPKSIFILHKQNRSNQVHSPLQKSSSSSSSCANDNLLADPFWTEDDDGPLALCFRSSLTFFFCLFSESFEFGSSSTGAAFLGFLKTTL